MAANHFHWYKTEDIINRGGGNCLIRVYNSLPNEEIDYESDVTVHCDARWADGRARSDRNLAGRSDFECVWSLGALHERTCLPSGGRRPRAGGES